MGACVAPKRIPRRLASSFSRYIRPLRANTRLVDLEDPISCGRRTRDVTDFVQCRASQFRKTSTKLPRVDSEQCANSASDGVPRVRKEWEHDVSIQISQAHIFCTFLNYQSGVKGQILRIDKHNGEINAALML